MKGSAGRCGERILGHSPTGACNIDKLPDPVAYELSEIHNQSCLVDNDVARLRTCEYRRPLHELSCDRVESSDLAASGLSKPYEGSLVRGNLRPEGNTPRSRI